MVAVRRLLGHHNVVLAEEVVDVLVELGGAAVCSFGLADELAVARQRGQVLLGSGLGAADDLGQAHVLADRARLEQLLDLGSI